MSYKNVNTKTKVDNKRLLILLFLELYVYLCSVCRYICASYAILVTTSKKETVRSLGTTNVCKSSCVIWELNLVPLEDQSVLLTTEKSLESLWIT